MRLPSRHVFRSLRQLPVPALVTALVGLAALTWWVYGFVAYPPVPERPLGIEEFPQRQAAGPTPPAASSALSFYRPPANFQPAPGLWPWFRGPERDNVNEDAVRLNLDWASGGPRVLWTVELGEGYAAPAVRNGLVYLLDYDQAGQADALRCFALSDGQEIWRQSYPVVIKRNHGMSRTIPAVTDEHVVVLGPKCHLYCADARTGKALWQKDLVAEFDVTVPEWYAGQCVLIDGDKVIVGTGGKALMVAFRLADGSVAWQTPNPRGWVMTHSSILPITVNGVRQYVWCGSGGVAGVSATDGKLLWENLEWVINTATVPTPVDLGGGRLFLSGGYDAGSGFLKIARQGSTFTARFEKRLTSRVFGADQQTPVLYKGHLYGVRSGGQMVCLDLNGNVLWDSGTDRFGLGPYLIWNGTLLALNDSGILRAIEATPSSYKKRAEAKILPGPEAWGPLAPAGSRLLARDLNRMVCLEVGDGR